MDDDPDFLERLTSELERTPGCIVKAASNAREAVESLTRHSYNIVISDWAIHNVTGPEVLIEADALVKDSGKKTPVVFISGDDRRALAKGLKPLTNFDPVTFVLKGKGARLITSTVLDILRKGEPGAETE